MICNFQKVPFGEKTNVSVPLMSANNAENSLCAERTQLGFFLSATPPCKILHDQVRWNETYNGLFDCSSTTKYSRKWKFQYFLRHATPRPLALVTYWLKKKTWNFWPIKSPLWTSSLCFNSIRRGTRKPKTAARAKNGVKLRFFQKRRVVRLWRRRDASIGLLKSRVWKMILAEVAKPTRHRAYVQSIRTL